MKQLFDLYNMSILIQEETASYRVLVVDIYSGTLIYPFDTLDAALNHAFQELQDWFQEILIDFEEMNSHDPLSQADFDRMIAFPLSLAVPSEPFQESFAAQHVKTQLQEEAAQTWERIVRSNSKL
ncbi:Uncharacterised protein [Listeria grayi]|uniref:Uncharacterized protein n=1 Tax=Listeria grayi FSL F6-1183 TaxID=1265827 RepID=A0A829R4T4_LISGR|nr:hypothetical protein [Listeria grayi]EUJ25840.1 hypothetical protein LMUR_14674 [Listeria grayi FSL F6-1183]VEI31403.1 Uncharacterised protein [Listeria grayi]